MKHAVPFLLLFGLSGCTSGPTVKPFPAGRVVDLSYAYDENTIYWPTEKGFELQKNVQGYTDKGYYYASFAFCTPEHGGTHLDAPIHFVEGRWTVDQIPLERLIGAAIVVDVSARCALERDYEVAVQDFLDWEERNGRIPHRAIVLLRTGFGRHWPNRELYMGTDARGPEAVAELSFPGLHPDAARWLVGERRIDLVGIDTPSIDHGPSTLFESHRILFDAQIPALENVARMDELPERGFHVIALPMKIRGGTGAPVRIAAIVPR